MEAEEAAARTSSDVNLASLPANYHNETNTDSRVGNNTVHVHQEVHKVRTVTQSRLLPTRSPTGEKGAVDRCDSKPQMCK